MFRTLVRMAAGLPVLPVHWAIGFVCTTAGVARANWLCLFATPSRIRSLVTPVPAGAWPLALDTCNFKLETPPPIGFVCSQQHHSSVLSYFRYLLRGTGNSLCHLTVSVCGPARRARGRRPPLPWACLVAAISAGSRSNIGRRLGILVCCAKNQKLHRNSDRPTRPAPEDRIPRTQDGGPWVGTWGTIGEVLTEPEEA